MNLIRRPFRYRFYHAALILVGVNIAVFLLQSFFPIVTGLAALTPILVVHGSLWQFFTYMFAHGGVSHLALNMLALAMFGSQVERHMGSREFLLYYLVTGALAGVLSFGIYAFTGAWGVHLLGASGALFAVQLAYAVFFPDSIIFLMGFIPLRARVTVLVFTAISLYSLIFASRDGVAHLTHLAGFAFGWIYFLARFSINPWRFLVRRRK